MSENMSEKCPKCGADLEIVTEELDRWKERGGTLVGYVEVCKRCDKIINAYTKFQKEVEV